jgi:hypothetical protein
VLGIKYDNLLIPFSIVGDCKSGKNVSDINRLFWLRGIKDFFGADQAYFIHSTIRSHARGVAPKLGISVMDEEALLTSEKILQVDKSPLPLEDEKFYTSVVNLWGINLVKGQKPDEKQLELKNVYSYLSYSYWYIEQHRNLFNLIEHFTKIATLFDENDKRYVLLAYTGLERFIHSLLEISVFVTSQGGTNILRDTRSYIYGGPLSLKEKESFFKLLRNLTHSNEQLDPPYLQDIIELLVRMIKNPMGSSDILRHISAIYAWCVYLGNDTLLPLCESGENTAAIVLARDAAQTFARLTGIKETIYSKILNL